VRRAKRLFDRIVAFQNLHRAFRAAVKKGRRAHVG